MSLSIFRAFLFGIALVFGCLTLKVSADELIDSLRLELSLIGSQIEDLRLDLVSPEVRSLEPSDAGIALLRLDALEAKLRSTVGQVEALEFHLQILSKDATHRITQFNSKLADIEQKRKTLNEETIDQTSKATNSKKLNNEISNESLALDKALLSFNSEDFYSAIEDLELFQKLYPESIHTAEVRFLLGQAKYKLNDFKGSASTFLDSFSMAPSGSFAWRALLGLAMSLGAIGQNEQGCLTLKELSLRFPEQVDENLNEVLRAKEQMKCSL